MIYFLLAAYNEEDSVEPVFSSIVKAGFGDSAILLVDDGSEDLTSERAVAAAGRFNIKLELLRHPENLGLGAALRSGFEWIDKNASPDDVVVTMDCDDTHPPETVKPMLSKLSAGDRLGLDAVIASRFVKGGGCSGVPRLRSAISSAGSLLISSLFPRSGVTDWTSGFRAYNVRALQKARIPALVQSKGFSAQLEILFLLLKSGEALGESPLLMDYSLKKSVSKMRLVSLLFEYFGVFARMLPLRAEKFLTSSAGASKIIDD